MLRTRDFLRDEQGGYTIWSLVWFMLYVAIGGLAVDVTDAYRNEIMLQSTADSAALAAAQSLPDQAKASAQALAFAADNMDSKTNGSVLLDTDVVLGTWDFDTRQFTATKTDPNAVWVITRRSVQNQNPVGMNFLRILALFGLTPEWNVATEAIAVKLIPGCVGNGLIAANNVRFSGNNSFVNDICIHGQNAGVTLQNNNTFADGVVVSMGSLSDLTGDPAKNPGLANALYEGDMWPKDVERLPEILEGLIPGADGVYTELPDFMYRLDPYGNRIDPIYQQIAPSYTGQLDPYHVYYVKCGNSTNQFTLPSINTQANISHVVIYSECRIMGSNLGEIDNAVFASAAPGSGSDPLSTTTIKLAGNADMGTPDSCAPGGGIYLYSMASVSFSAGGNINGLKAVVAGDFEMTAGGGGASGVDIEAGVDIRVTSNNTFGNCPTNNDIHAWTYRLVR